MFAGTPTGIFAGVVFTAILLAAAAGDLRTRRIPNRLVLLLAVLGVIYSVAAGPVIEGFTRAGGGLLTGLGIWLPFYALGWLGAGDVKLFAAAGTWLGPMGALEGAVMGALAGAVLALGWMVKERGMRGTVEVIGMSAETPSLLTPSGKNSSRSTLPYGIAIAFGAIWAGWVPRMVFT